jgi:hypothetical protein
MLWLVVGRSASVGAERVKRNLISSVGNFPETVNVMIPIAPRCCTAFRLPALARFDVRGRGCRADDRETDSKCSPKPQPCASRQAVSRHFGCDATCRLCFAKSVVEHSGPMTPQHPRRFWRGRLAPHRTENVRARCQISGKAETAFRRKVLDGDSSRRAYRSEWIGGANPRGLGEFRTRTQIHFGKPIPALPQPAG